MQTTIDAQEKIDAAKMRWFDTLPEPWPLTDDAADEAIAKALAAAGLPLEGDTTATVEEYSAVIWPALTRWHKPNPYATRSDNSVTYDTEAIEAKLVELGATPEEADRMTDGLHEQGWGGFEDRVLTEEQYEAELEDVIDSYRETWAVDAQRAAELEAE